MQNLNIHNDLSNIKNADLLIRLYQSGIQCTDMKDFFGSFSNILSDVIDFNGLLVIEQSPDLVDYEVIYSENTGAEIIPLLPSIIENEIITQDVSLIKVEPTEDFNIEKSIAVLKIDKEENKNRFLIFIINSFNMGFISQDEIMFNQIVQKISSVVNKLVFGSGVNVQQKIQSILEFVYDFAIIFDSNGIILFSNQIAKDKLSLTDEEVYTIENLFEDTTQILEFIDYSPYNAKEIYTELISVYGKLYPSRILLTKLSLNNQSMIFAIGKDINEEEYYRNTEIRNSADNLLFKIIADFILDLLGKDDINNALLAFLPNFARLLYADRIFLAKLNNNIPENNFEITIAWNIDYKKADTTENLTVSAFNIPENSKIMELFLEHNPIKAVLSDCNVALCPYFEKYNFKSIHVVPIFVNDQLSGLFGIIDNLEEKYWTGNEANALIIIANAIAASLERKETYKQLVIARLAAEDAFKSKSNFLSCMSHEIRTPLNGIIGMAELLHMTYINEEQLEFVDTIQESANNLVDVVNDILDLSKIDSGNFSLDNRIYNFRDLVKKTVYTISTDVFEKGLELIVDVDNNIPVELIGDSLRYKQVLINIIGNAVKYTYKGEIIIKIRMELLKDNNIAILTCIQDTGIGISEEKLDYIFESFTKADYSTANTNRGTGLGLTISKKIIEMMGGSISCKSKLGYGSSFEFITYFKIADNTPIDYSDNYSVKPGIKLLIIEDNKTSRNILIKYLGKFTDNITTMESTEDVLSLIKKLNQDDCFDSIIIDSSVNNNNSIEFISDLRDIENAINQNIILLLSGELSQIEKEFVDSNNVNCIHKPVFAEDLYNFLNNTVLIKNKTEIEIMKINQEKTDIAKSTHTFTVLVAEDNLFNLKLSITLLKKKNWNIITAENGLDAVQFYKENRIDLVLLDIQMPEMNGYEAAVLIRQEQERTKHYAPIIALTAYAMKGDREKAINAGMDEYMAKPLEPNKFYDVLNSQIIKYKNKSNPHFIFEDLVKKFSNDPYALRTHLEKSIIYLRKFTTELNDYFNLRDFENIKLASESLIGHLGKDYFPDINSVLDELLDNINKDDLEAINHSKNYLIDEVARFVIYYKDTIMPKFE